MGVVAAIQGPELFFRPDEWRRSRLLIFIRYAAFFRIRSLPFNEPKINFSASTQWGWDFVLMNTPMWPLSGMVILMIRVLGVEI